MIVVQSSKPCSVLVEVSSGKILNSRWWAGVTLHGSLECDWLDVTRVVKPFDELENLKSIKKAFIYMHIHASFICHSRWTWLLISLPLSYCSIDTQPPHHNEFTLSLDDHWRPAEPPLHSLNGEEHMVTRRLGIGLQGSGVVLIMRCFTEKREQTGGGIQSYDTNIQYYLHICSQASFFMLVGNVLIPVKLQKSQMRTARMAYQYSGCQEGPMMI